MTAPDLSLDGMKVRNDAMETLGSVDGFIVDNTSMGPYYVVVDSGGWFKSKDFLVPIGHARIDDDKDALVIDINKSRIERFPGFDKNQFERLNEDDIRRMNDAICEACNDASTVYPAGDPLSTAWGRPDYQQPDWWSATSGGSTFGTGASLGAPSYVATEDYPATKVARATGELQAEQELTIADREHRQGDTRSAERDRELVTAREAEPIPHLDGRAQPGDVLGIETGGEQSHVGDTTEDENKRRIDAERAAGKRKN